MVAVSILTLVGLTGCGDDDAARRDPSTTTTAERTGEQSTTTAIATTMTTAAGQVPAAVSVVHVRPGGGSGEVVVDWEAVQGATGYRVLRSTTVGAGATIVAELSVATGEVTVAPGVVNLYSDEHSYVPAGDPFEGPDQSSSFWYVEVAGTGERCFRIVADNAAGGGVPSVVTCGSPP